MICHHSTSCPFLFQPQNTSVLSLQHVYCAILSAFTMVLFLFQVFSSWISCFVLLCILLLLIIFFILCHCYPFFIVLQHVIVIQATSGLIRLDPFRHYCDSFSMDGTEIGWYLSCVVSMLNSFLSFIHSGAVFSMLVWML